MPSTATSKEIFRPPLFSFKNGPLTRLPFNKAPHFSLLDFPADIRNVIYHFAVVVPFVIRNDNTSYKNDRKRRDRITVCFTFLRTCRQVYEEASPVFWGGNTFLLQARMVETETPFSESFAPFRLQPDDIVTEANDPTHAWHVNVGVQSHTGRKQVRRVVWNYGNDADPALRHAKCWRLSKSTWLNLGEPFLPNVTELTIMFDDSTSSLTRFPCPQNVEAYVRKLWEVSGVRSQHETFLWMMQRTSAALRESTFAHLCFFARFALPNICTVRIGAWVDEGEHVPTKLLPEDGDFFREIAAKVGTLAKKCEYAGVHGVSRNTLSLEAEGSRNSAADAALLRWMLKVDNDLRYHIYYYTIHDPPEFDMVEPLYDPGYEQEQHEQILQGNEVLDW